MMMLNARANPDGTVTLSLPRGPQTLTAEEFDDIIAYMGTVRRELVQGPPLDPPVISPNGAIPDPRYWVAPANTPDAVLLLLRHLGFGWLTFIVPAGEAETLGRFLIEEVQALQPGPEAAPSSEGQESAS